VVPATLCKWLALLSAVVPETLWTCPAWLEVLWQLSPLP
jgi:hypothetical protein